MQELARIAPERMERLALLDTGFRADTPDRAAMRRRLDGAARTPGQFHGFEEDLLQTYLHPKNVDNTAINGRIRDMTERLGAAVFLRQRAEGWSRSPRNLCCPVLFLCGERDMLSPLTEHQAMAALVPQARLVVIPRSGHMTPLENPGAVTAALRAWLASAAKD